MKPPRSQTCEAAPPPERSVEGHPMSSSKAPSSRPWWTQLLRVLTRVSEINEKVEAS